MKGSNLIQHQFENGELLVTDLEKSEAHLLPPLTASLFQRFLDTGEQPQLQTDEETCAWNELVQASLVPEDSTEHNLARREFIGRLGRTAAAACFISTVPLANPAAAASDGMCQNNCAGFIFGTCIDCSGPTCDGSQCCFEIICVGSSSSNCAGDRRTGEVRCETLSPLDLHLQADCSAARDNAISGGGLRCTDSGDTGDFYGCCENC